MTGKTMLIGLNPQQKAAVEYLDSPLFLSAGAGSGKTKVLTHKLAYLVKGKGITPHRILAITFTKKAANEMAERIEKMLSIKPRWISTFHSFCAKVLREDIHAMGMPFDRRFVIYDEDDSVKVLKDLLKKRDLDPKEAKAAKEVISRAKQAYRASTFDYIRGLSYPASAYAELAQEYQQELFRSNAMDYDDLLYYTVHLLSVSPETRKKWHDSFDYIMIDEFQDTNDIQFDLIRLLASRKKGLFAVGDFFQCIYTWRGSRPSNIGRFIKEFGAKEMKLEKNYRSTKKILDVANTIISGVGCYSSDRVLELHTDKEEEGEVTCVRKSDGISESIWIAEKIRELSASHPYSDIAILIRMTFLSRGFESVFMQYNIPYTIVRGVAFYERAEVKDLLSYLRFISNHRDKAAFERVVNTPSRGIGKKGTSVIGDSYRIDWVQAMRDAAMPQRQRKNLDEFIRMVEKYTESVENKPFTVLMDILNELQYLRYLEREYKEDHEDRIENVSELANVLERLQEDGKPFSEFMEDSLLSSDQDRIGNEDSVKILTLHAAKGLEWPVVFMPALEEEIFPSAKSVLSDSALEEERRLFYVGTTRAKENLYLSSADVRMKFGQTLYSMRSRYIKEIQHHFTEQ